MAEWLFCQTVQRVECLQRSVQRVYSVYSVQRMKSFVAKNDVMDRMARSMQSTSEALCSHCPSFEIGAMRLGQFLPQPVLASDLRAS